MKTVTHIALAWLLAAVLASCGGGTEQVAGVGTGGTGFASGTVSGFGSIILDGDRYDDTGAIYEIEDDPRALTPRVVTGGALLGERVEATLRATGGVERVRIEPALIGPARDLDVFQMTLRVAGQVVKVNINPNNGPVTLLDWPTLGTMLRGGNLQVHGLPVYDDASGSYRLYASRISEVSALPANLVRTSGVVSALTTADFRLGDLTVRLPAGGALVVPAGRTLANGQNVTVWGTSLSGSPPAQTLDAVGVRIRALNPTPAGTPLTSVAGTIGRLDSANATFDLAGVSVDARNANVVPALPGLALANGQYVIVRGAINASGTLVATQVRIRRTVDEPEIELRGAITDFVSDSNFRVRGTLVDATGVTQRPSCPPQLRNGLMVQIVGGVKNGSQNVVTAERLSCPGN